MDKSKYVPQIGKLFLNIQFMETILKSCLALLKSDIKKSKKIWYC